MERWHGNSYASRVIDFYLDEIVFLEKKILSPLADLEREINSQNAKGVEDREKYNDLVRRHKQLARGLFILSWSMWEIQLREYLISYAGFNDSLSKVKKMASKNHFKEMLECVENRGKVTFPGDIAEYLDLANVCRHGVGAALKRLYVNYNKKYWNFDLGEEVEQITMLVNLRLSVEDIERFLNKARLFWYGVEYTSNLEVKYS